MHIALAATFPSTAISGGRLHAWLLAVALSRKGHAVTIIANQLPNFLELLPIGLRGHKLTFKKLRFDLLRGPKAYRPDLWVIAHERSLNGRFFQPIFENCRRWSIPSLTLLFEPPNWPEAMDPRFVPGELDSLIDEAERIGGSFLCSCQQSKEWALRLWPHRQPEDFSVANPPVIESDPQASPTRDPRLMVCFTRRASPHKGFALLMGLADTRFVDYRVVVVDSTPLDPAARQLIAALNRAGGAQFEFRSSVSESEKASLLQTARLLLFPSAFEGFGLPPAEAQLWGTPVVALDLPALREIHGDNIRYASAETFCETVARELESDCDYRPSDQARTLANFERWTEQVDAAALASVRNAKARKAEASGPMSSQPQADIIIIDQLGDWNAADTAASLGSESPRYIRFEANWAARWRRHQLASAVGDGAAPYLVGYAEDRMREKLLEAALASQSEFVALFEDLHCCTPEVLAAALAKLGKSGKAAGIAFPSRYHFQRNGYRHLYSKDGFLLASAGVFRRDALVETLQALQSPGCSLQPIADLSYAFPHTGHSLIAADEGCELLPPRSLGYLWAALASFQGSWQNECQADEIGPIPAASPQEAPRNAALRRKGLELFARASLGEVPKTHVLELDAELQQADAHWLRYRQDHHRLRGLARIGGNFPLFSSYFYAKNIFTEFLKCLQATDSGAGEYLSRSIVALR